MEQIPPDIQHMLAQFQQIQQQAQAMGSQRVQMEMQLKEVDRSSKELAQMGEDAEVYKTVGTLLLKSDKASIEKELAEKREVLELRIKTLKKQEEKLQARLKEMQENIQSQLRGTGKMPSAG